MPADSEVTFRPLGVRLSGALFGGMLLVVSVGAWVLLDPKIKAVFTYGERFTTLLIYAAAYTTWYAMARSRVTATADSLIVVNGFKRRDFAWPQVIALRLNRGAPWATLDLSDGTSVPVMGIHGSDGKRARTAVRALRQLIAERSYRTG